jgi:hypothetical protein
MRRRFQNPARATRPDSGRLAPLRLVDSFVRGSGSGVASPPASGCYDTDTVPAALVVAGGASEICSILGWAAADLAVVLREVGRRPALSSAETQLAGVSRGRLVARN